MANKKYVPQGTYLACDKGTVPMEFMITNNNNTFLFDEPVANTGDMVPMLNVMPMGVCMVTGSACVPAPIMWEGFEDGVFVGFFNPLLEDSVLQCTVGGKIEIFYSLEDAEGACAEEGMGFWEKLAVAVVVVAAVVLIVASGGAALAAVGAASAAYSAGAMGTMAVMGGVAALEVYGVYSGVKGLYNYSQDGDFESLAKDVALGYLFWGAGAAIGKGYKMYKANKLAKAIDEERILKEVFESMDHNGTGKNVIKIGDEALEAGDESLKLVEDINYSRKAYEKALKNHDVLPASKKVKTTASDGKNTVSGSSPKRISNKTRDAMGGVDDVSPGNVMDQSDEIGHTLNNNSSIDNGIPGQASASHAEKQLLTAKPGEAIGVSKPMCTNCKSFAQKQADAIGKDIVITDPDGTKIFRPGESSPIDLGWD